MRDLIASPTSAWAAFFKGTGAVVSAMLVPMGFMVVRASKTPAEMWMNAGRGALILLAAGAIAGAVFAIPKVLYRMAYRRVGGDPGL